MNEVDDKAKQMFEAALKLMENEHAMSEERKATMLGRQAEFVPPKYEPRIEVRGHFTYKEIRAILQTLEDLQQITETV